MNTPYALCGTAGYEDLARDGVLLTADPQFGDLDTQCEFCTLAGQVCTVRVYGRPAPRIPLPLGLAECCRTCAPALIERALDEQDEWAPGFITVEIATPIQNEVAA